MSQSGHGIEIELGRNHGFTRAIGFDDHLTGGSGDERGSVERERVLSTDLDTHAIGRDHRHQVGASVSLHHALPVTARIPRRIERFAADRGGIQNHFGAAQREHARRLGEPLIPTDGDADAAHFGVPHAKAGVARIEVVLLRVTRTVGNVALAVHAEDGAVGVDDGHRIERGVVGALEETHWKHHTEFGRESCEVGDGRVTLERSSPAHVLGQLIDAEVMTLEQFRNLHETRPA